MPSGLKRYKRAESLHFITFSCFRRLALLEAREAKETVEAVLEQARARNQAKIYAYVLMPEHVHLLVNEPPGLILAQFLKAVKQVTSRKLRGTREKFWQDRYYDSNIRAEAARSEVIRYIHRNPVARGLVEKPEDWAWSSIRHHAMGAKGTVEIESKWTAFRRENQLPEGVSWTMVERSCFPPKQQTTLLGWGTSHPAGTSRESIDRATCRSIRLRPSAVAVQRI
jgi:putative transposase